MHHNNMIDAWSLLIAEIQLCWISPWAFTVFAINHIWEWMYSTQTTSLWHASLLSRHRMLTALSCFITLLGKHLSISSTANTLLDSQLSKSILRFNTGDALTSHGNVTETKMYSAKRFKKRTTHNVYFTELTNRKWILSWNHFTLVYKHFSLKYFYYW